MCHVFAVNCLFLASSGPSSAAPTAHCSRIVVLCCVLSAVVPFFYFELAAWKSSSFAWVNTGTKAQTNTKKRERQNERKAQRYV